jgi:hypothetical protein
MLWMSEPGLGHDRLVAVKYPSLKSICFARSGVIEKDEADMSKRPWAMLTMMVSNGCLMNSDVGDPDARRGGDRLHRVDVEADGLRPSRAR